MTRMRSTRTASTAALCLLGVLVSAAVCAPLEPRGGPDGEPPWKRRQREMADKMGGLPESVLREQSTEPVQPPSLDDAATAAFAAAKAAAAPLLEAAYVHEGKVRTVPDQFATIQAALDASAAGDTVIVREGVYYELLTMKDGVKLISDDADDGNALVAVENARLRLPRRALRTILDGSKSEPSSHGMIDFEPGSGRQTVVDGFTFRALPAQDHHVPGHAHGLNVRGASPVIARCLLRDIGSTGIGNHVVYKDQSAPMPERDFRRANIAHEASAVIYGNVISGSRGLGIGCNHFSTPFVLGNEMFGNDDSDLGAEVTPAIGAKHGARPTIVGNVIHGNAGGGILCKVGAPQGAHPVDGRTTPTVRSNLVFANGAKMPGLSCAGAGTADQPVVFDGNWIYDSGAVGIGVSEGSVAIVTGNTVARSKGVGIAIHGAVIPDLSRNGILAPGGPGITVVSGTKVHRMQANRVQDADGARFALRDAEVREPGPAAPPNEEDE